MPLSILVKPTHDCNLSCVYCYDKSFDERTKRMSVDDIKKILDMAEKTSDTISWIWHGGEPLIMGIDFYRESMKILRESKSKIHVTMQTNGTLLTDDFVKEFSDIGFGISYDGIFHDKNRCNSSKDTLRGVDIISKNNLNPGTIQVVNKENYNLLLDDYKTMKSNNIKCYHMNLVFDSYSKESISVDKIDEYLKSYYDLFAYWISDENPIDVGNFYDKIRMLLGKKQCMCNSSGKCYKVFFGVNPDGAVYPCDRWIPDKYSYGNIHDIDSFKDIRKSEKYKEYVNINKTRKKYCKENCEFFFACNGECPSNAILDNGGTMPNLDRCKFIKGELSIIFNIIKNIDINKIKNKKLVRMLQDLNYRPLSICRELEEWRVNR